MIRGNQASCENLTSLSKPKSYSKIYSKESNNDIIKEYKKDINVNTTHTHTKKPKQPV